MKYIKLTQGKKAIVDDEDFERLNQWKWYEHHGYAVRSKRVGARRFNKTSQIFMHRLINQTSDGFDTDHINRNKLDNRRKNLRTATRSQNQFNRGNPSNNTSKYKGVIWDKNEERWMSRITIQGKSIFLGRYKNIQEAFLARKQGEDLFIENQRSRNIKL